MVLLLGAAILTALAAAPVEPAAPEPAGDRGELLARKYCTSCHAYTPPEALTREGWRPGLMHMVARLGLAQSFLADPPAGFTRKDERHVLYHLTKLRQLDPPLLPTEPLVPREDFLEIQKYLLEHAPEQPLPQIGKTPVGTGPTPFRLGPRVAYDENAHVVISLVAIDETDRRVFVGGVSGWDPEVRDHPSYLRWLDASGRVVDDLSLPSAPVSLQRVGKKYYLTTVGSLATIQSRDAQLLLLQARKNRLRTQLILDHELRAAGSEVHPGAGGQRLIAFHGFGYYVGELSLLREKNGKIASRLPLLEEPGAMASRFGDFDGDGRLDLISLFSQHRESMLLFRDDGLGGYETVELLAHPPPWGLSSFDLADFDSDGVPELVISNGDNTDYLDPPLKSYHGVRIYVNTAGRSGVPRYEERWFEPIHGAFKVLARDFDLDGDVDLAVIARYLDETAARRESFLYLANRTRAGTPELRFDVSVIPDLESSDFMTMTAGDLDGDSDLDLVLGGAVPLQLKRPRPAPPLGLVYLINQTR